MEATFFSGVQVRIKIGSPTKQESTGRICLPLTMPLDDGLAKGWPDWLTDAYGAVQSHAKKFVPDLEQVADIGVMFNAEAAKTPDLFALPDAKFPHSELKTFAVVREGDPDDWEVVLRFTMYTSFQREGWAWLGEMAGKDVFMGFPRDLEKTGGAVAQESSKQGTMVYKDANLEAERRESLKPEHDAEFARSAPPAAPSMSESTGEPEAAASQSNARRTSRKSIN